MLFFVLRVVCLFFNYEPLIKLCLGTSDPVVEAWENFAAIVASVLKSTPFSFWDA